jgi:hypothetical protein
MEVKPVLNSRLFIANKTHNPFRKVMLIMTQYFLTILGSELVYKSTIQTTHMLYILHELLKYQKLDKFVSVIEWSLNPISGPSFEWSPSLDCCK